MRSSVAVVGLGLGFLAVCTEAFLPGAPLGVSGLRSGAIVAPSKRLNADFAVGLRGPAVVRLRATAKSDPWGGRIGSMSTLEFKDGYDVLRHVIASLPRQSGYQTFKGVFSKIDEDKSGMLDGVEMKNALAKITGSITDEHIDLVMATLDSDKDGEVSYEEFSNALEMVELQIEQTLESNDVMMDPEF